MLIAGEITRIGKLHPGDICIWTCGFTCSKAGRMCESRWRYTSPPPRWCSPSPPTSPQVVSHRHRTPPPHTHVSPYPQIHWLHFLKSQFLCFRVTWWNSMMMLMVKLALQTKSPVLGKWDDWAFQWLGPGCSNLDKPARLRFYLLSIIIYYQK